ncbi:LysR family transcriptional regulator [Cedecea neteri]|uniref:LysR family transcriptional regulator n=1 Tax=Cedecea neteri TaxID=158822 RepID=A0A291E5V8_9ENTR|nr:LysR family transcriptional regulator [Cedecea neteri]
MKAFLALARHHHFGKAAEECAVSQPRISQLIRGIETKIGGSLFNRTSRQVTLTVLGQQLFTSLEPAYGRLEAIYYQAQNAARGVTGILRLGFMGSGANELMAPLLTRFRERYPDCDIELVETSFSDPLGPLRRGEVDVTLTRLPVQETDLTVGPVMISEGFILAVGLQHRLATRTHVSLEELKSETMFAITGNAPDYWWDHHVPRETPSGVPISRGAKVGSFQELLTLVAAGKGVSTMAASVAVYYPRPDIKYIPVVDGGENEVALVWRSGEQLSRIKALVDVARSLLVTSR